MSSKIIVTCNGSELSWVSVLVRKSLDEICHYVEVTLPLFERDNVHKHDTIQVRYKNPLLTDHGGERPVTTVLVDEVGDDTDSQSAAFTVTGRSAARDIIDSTWSGIIAGNPNLLTIVQTIAGEFGIEAMHMPTNENGTKAVYSFSWENESPWTKLLTEADAQGYILTSNQIGNLYLWKPATGIRKEGFKIVEGETGTKIRRVENGAEQFHEYTVNCCGLTATVTDPTCRNKRKFTLNLSDFVMDQEKINRRAKTEMLRRRENRIVATVPEWGLSDMQIKALGSTFQKERFWEVNFLIPVKIPSAGVSGKMLVSQVEYKADAKSVSCDITLVNPEGYR